jgi:hypothetical protein
MTKTTRIPAMRDEYGTAADWQPGTRVRRHGSGATGTITRAPYVIRSGGRFPHFVTIHWDGQSKPAFRPEHVSRLERLP